MAGILKVFAVISLVLGTIGAIVLANVGYEFSFMTFLTSEVEVLVSFLILYGVGSIWNNQDSITAEHAEIMRMLRGADPKKEKDIKASLSHIENRQLQILDMLKTRNPETEETTKEIKQEDKAEKKEDLPHAFIVERTYEDIKKRRASTGWKCKKCGKSNPLSRKSCLECGTPK